MDEKVDAELMDELEEKLVPARQTHRRRGTRPLKASAASDGGVLVEVTGMRKSEPAAAADQLGRAAAARLALARRLCRFRSIADAARGRESTEGDKALQPGKSGYTGIRSVLSLVSFSLEIDTVRFSLRSHADVFDANASPATSRCLGSSGPRPPAIARVTQRHMLAPSPYPRDNV